MRTAFIHQLIEEAKTNDKIFLLVGDLGFSVVEPFAEQFPERFLNVGIAEQNMVGIAAGLAMEGYCVYVYSIGNFPTLRCIEQIRYDVCYHNLNVKIVAVGGGYAYAALGPSHHATEEVGMLRTIPNIVICTPGDPAEAKAITTFSARYSGPCYIRIGKAGEPTVHTKQTFLEPGDILPVIESTADIAVFSSGAMLKYSFDFISENNVNSSLYSFPFVKPLRKAQLISLFKKYKRVITIEEHQLNGGFGSVILEELNNFSETEEIIKTVKVRRIGIPNKFFSIAGSQEYLRKAASIELKKEFFTQENRN